MGTKPKKKSPHIQNVNIWLNYFRDLYKHIPEEDLTPKQQQITTKLRDIEEAIKDFQNPLGTSITTKEIQERKGKACIIFYAIKRKLCHHKPLVQSGFLYEMKHRVPGERSKGSISVTQYKAILAFMFTIDDINKRDDLLPNITLGYHIFDNCGNPLKAINSAIHIISGNGVEIPNYSCSGHGEVAAFVTHPGFHHNSALIQFLSLYKFVQVSYGIADPLLSDRVLYPTLYHVSSNDYIRCVAIAKLLKYFGWNWVGIITIDNWNGEMEADILSKKMAQHGICTAFVAKINKNMEEETKMRLANIRNLTVEVIVIAVFFDEDYAKYFYEAKLGNYTLILHESWLNKYVKAVNYIDNIGLRIHFNDRGEVPTGWQVAFRTLWIYRKIGVLRMNKTSFYFNETNDELQVNEEKIIWKNDKKPQARCNEPCSPGYRKAPNGGHHVCCYNCVSCSEGEVSNTTDSDMCHKCPEGEWSDEKRVKCVPKPYEFLSYETDVLSLIFLVLCLFFSSITLFIIGIFTYYLDAKIVKANNRATSFILLASILLSLQCVFFFIGVPVHTTCLLRQISFGIFFTIGISSVLAKTITVCIAFKATKPGSFWRKFVSPKIANGVVLVCSTVQLLICVIWLCASPPYVEFDSHTYLGKIIIQCNEGSVIAFYSMLGYMGLLAAVSFLLAFMVRTLPDIYNEAKYITFSMLLFCSVWIAMIPAYLSTKGKYIVVVEIFAIVTSCAGVLGCIFFPKLYFLLLKPQSKVPKKYCGEK
ncbi:vomeronasal type-2 receptor 26-like [Leptodactylus fuscus]